VCRATIMGRHPQTFTSTDIHRPARLVRFVPKGLFRENAARYGLVFWGWDMTKTNRYIFACLAGLIAFGMLGNPASAYKLKSALGGFVAELNSEPRFTKYNSTTVYGKYTRYEWLLDDGAKAWIVGYSDYATKGVIAKAGLQNALETAVQSTAGKNKLRSAQPITRWGLTGRDFLIDLPDKLVMRSWIFRLYQAIFVGPIGSEDSADVTAFLENFRFD
jgi:hypothetical protein